MTSVISIERDPGRDPHGDTIDLEVVVPVYNEEAALEASIRRLHRFLSSELPLRTAITIADNASVDGTWRIARRLEAELPEVQAVHLDRKGRGRALRTAWSHSGARVVAYMDVDLSTDLSALYPLVAPLLSGHSDLAIGTRLAKSSRVARGLKRELISRGYNTLLRLFLRVGFSDAQCGFKAIRTDCARRLLPLVEDDNWFFDTEMLVLAERAGMRIHEVPVDWVDDPDSRVDIVATAVEDLKGMFRVAWGLATGRIRVPEALDRGLSRRRRDTHGLVGQLVRFGTVGVGSTIFYLAAYLTLRSFTAALVANTLALLVATIANTAANRWFTFGIRGRRRVLVHQTQGLFVFALAWGLTSASLATLATLVPHPSRAAEVAALVVANGMATLVRFALLRGWVFREHRIDDGTGVA